jgi:hypothetical protein
MNAYAECAPANMARYDRPAFGFIFAPLTVGITEARLYPQEASITPMGIENLNSSFFTSVDQINRGAVRFGSPRGAQGIGGAWDKPYSPIFFPSFPGETLRDFDRGRDIPYTGFRVSNPLAVLDYFQRMAMTFSRVSLQQIVAEAIGFYVFNHNVWYADKLGLTVEQLREQQRAVASAGLDRTSAPILGVVGAVGSAVNPAIGLVVGIVNAIGKELLLNFIQIRPDTPKPLFLRVPNPNVCEGRPETQAGASLCPPGTTGVFPQCVPIPTPPTPPEDEGSSFPIVPVAAAIAVAVVLFAASRKKSKLGEYDDEAEEYIWTAKDSLERSRWYKKPRAEDDTRKGSVRFDRIPAKPGEKHGTPIIIIDESFDCKDLNDTIDDLKFAMDDLDEVQQSDDENGTDYAYALWWKLDRQIERVRRLARANGCTTISGLRRRT